MQYDPKAIEPKWQKYWEERGMNRADDASQKPKRYVLDMFPYPSGGGLHVGHVEGYTATDIFSRYLRMQGHNVLHPMGWDAFGLPAENAAIKAKTHPAKLVFENIAQFKQQLKRLGFSYDWSREINTTDPSYYKWTQWIFLKLFERGLAYQAEAPVNFCPSCKTGLANEEVVDGRCERCGAEVERRMLKQWMLKITAYADRLLDDLNGLDWPERIKEMQRNWIGRSEGTEVRFMIHDSRSTIHELPVFTTRADTLFGATYVTLAPEHSFVSQEIQNPKSKIQNRDEVVAYVERAKRKSEIERQEEGEKTGVRLEGIVAVNPVNSEELPVFVAEYVLAHYGTGAIMAVPAHDERDFQFAKTHGLPIREVVTLNGKQTARLETAYVEDGVLVNSGDFSGLSSVEAREKIIEWLEGQGKGAKRVHYKLRDWIFSRQRFWGEPIPLVFCERCKKRVETLNPKPETLNKSKTPNPNTQNGNFSNGEILNPGWVAVPEDQLPVELPDVERYEPTGTGESPLAAIEEWVQTKCPRCGGPARRETNTMPQWAGSCWYYLRFMDPHNDAVLVGAEKERYWAPVDLYVGGAEHAVLHLLYARFWHKVLYDEGVVSTSEPFAKLVNQGLILGPDHQKMSKSRGNVINPDEVIASYGADTLRLYEMFMGPLEDVKPWDTKGIIGLWRFLNKVYVLVSQNNAELHSGVANAEQRGTNDVERLRHRTIRKVTEDIEAFKFNTAIAALMEFSNEMSKSKTQNPKNAETLVLLLAPFAPHLTEELWSSFAKASEDKQSVHEQFWPEYDPAMIEEDTVTVVVQVNGKTRGQATVRRGATEAEVRKAAADDPRIAKYLSGATVERTIFVPDRLVNFVAGRL